MAPEATPQGPAGEAEAEVIKLDRELSEIDGLIAQAREESKRHEQRRVLAEEQLASVLAEEAAGASNLKVAIDGLVTATRRAWLMEAQIDVLEGKQRTLARFRVRLQHYAGLLGTPELLAQGDLSATGGDDVSAAPSSVQVQVAQETLRRDIARAMHDGPAQSMTNIALQTQIVERVLARDPGRAEAEVSELLRMVRQTLEETKTFIFDIRPMVLDDLGLVPTMQRAVRDRGRKANVPIDFDSRGQDRRLGPDIESSVFRVLDDAIVGFLSAKPARLTVRLAWGDAGLRADVRSTRPEGTPTQAPEIAEVVDEAPIALPELDDDLPPALAAMIMERRAAATLVADVAAGAAAGAAAAAARAAEAAGSLPEATWKAIRARVSFGKMSVELLDHGRLLVAEVAYPG